MATSTCTKNKIFQILVFTHSVIFMVFIIYFIQNYDAIRTPLKILYDCSSAVNRLSRTQNAHCDSNRLGPLSNCSLADVKMRPGVVMLTTTNFGFKDMTLNMLESIKRTGVCVNTTIIAEDQKCYRYLSQRAEGDPAVHVVLTNSGETTSKEIPRRQRKQYYALFNKRQEYFLGLLEQGYEVLFTDSDTFWFSDPFPYFKGDFDMSMIDPRSPYPTRTNRSHYCAGFAYFKPTNVTVRFVKAWIKTMRDNDKIGRLLADQDVMNMLLRGDRPVHVNVQPLDTNIFPWGPKFYELLAKKANYSTIVMHAASIRGYAAKVTKFKSSNMWLVKTESSDFFQLYLNGLTLLITVFISSLGIGCCCCYCCFYRCFMYNEDGPTAKEGHGKP